jgi:hypothetical protein
MMAHCPCIGRVCPHLQQDSNNRWITTQGSHLKACHLDLSVCILENKRRPRLPQQHLKDIRSLSLDGSMPHWDVLRISSIGICPELQQEPRDFLMAISYAFDEEPFANPHHRRRLPRPLLSRAISLPPGVPLLRQYAERFQTCHTSLPVKHCTA